MVQQMAMTEEQAAAAKRRWRARLWIRGYWAAWMAGAGRPPGAPAWVTEGDWGEVTRELAQAVSSTEALVGYLAAEAAAGRGR